MEGQLNSSFISSDIISPIDDYDDYIMIQDQKLKKPFVEKPFDAEDHNIHIYYPKSKGGGIQKLFRKVGNESSRFYPDKNEIRKEGIIL